MTTPDPSLDEILDWLEGRLAPADAAAMQARCATAGPATAVQVEWVRWFLDNARQVPLEAPPPLVTQRLRRLARRRREAAVPPRQLTAELVLDSRDAGQAAGVRAPTVQRDDRFQLTYRTEHLDVVLDISRDGASTVHVRGQVLVGRDILAVFEAAAHGPFGTIRSILGDELGGFDLAGVPDTVASMSVTNDDVVVELRLPPTVPGPG